MPSSVLQVTWKDQGTTRVVVATGELDVASAARLRREVELALSERPETIVLDLSALAFCDSAGARVTFAAQRRATADGIRFEVVRPTGPARRVFEICDGVAAAVA